MKKFARFLSIVLSIALLLSVAPTALAATSAQREALAAYLKLMMPYENVWDGVNDTTYDNLFDIGAFNSDDNEAVIVYANGTGVDEAIKKIVTGASDANTGLILEVLFNFTGKLAKNIKAYGLNDADVYFMYVTETAYAGGEYCFIVEIEVAKSRIYILQDDIFGLSSGYLSFSDVFDPVTYELSLSD